MRKFTKKNMIIGLSCSIIPGSAIPFSIKNTTVSQCSKVPILGKEKKQIFVDDLMLSKIHEVKRKVYQASKLEHPVLEADKSWEQGYLYNEEETGVFMFMARY